MSTKTDGKEKEKEKEKQGIMETYDDIVRELRDGADKLEGETGIDFMILPGLIGEFKKTRKGMAAERRALADRLNRACRTGKGEGALAGKIREIVARMREDAEGDTYTPDGLLGQSLNCYADELEKLLDASGNDILGQYPGGDRQADQGGVNGREQV